MLLLISAPVTYEAEVIQVDRIHRRELERLSLHGDPDAQAALDRFLDRYGHVVARDQARNLVTDIGARYVINTVYPAPGDTAVLPQWYIGLRGAGTPANGDTMASHPTWSELTGYSQSTRPAFVPATATTGRSLSNAASRAIFTPTSSFTATGTFLVNNSAKGGSTGTLMSVSALGAPRALNASQTYRLQATIAVP